MHGREEALSSTLGFAPGACTPRGREPGEHRAACERFHVPWASQERGGNPKASHAEGSKPHLLNIHLLSSENRHPRHRCSERPALNAHGASVARASLLPRTAHPPPRGRCWEGRCLVSRVRTRPGGTCCCILLTRNHVLLSPLTCPTPDYFKHVPSVPSETPGEI